MSENLEIRCLSLGNERAFPFQERESGWGRPEHGLSKREYFAARALQGFLAVGDLCDEAAVNAVIAADDLIAELSRDYGDES